MNKEKELRIIDKITYAMLGVAFVLVMALLVKNTIAYSKTVEERYYVEEPMSNDFFIENVLCLDEDEDGYVFSYAFNDTTFVDVYTSVIEGDELRTYLDLWRFYQYIQEEEELDRLRSYLIGNCHFEYEKSPYFEGWLWYYDACEIYRYGGYE